MDDSGSIVGSKIGIELADHMRKGADLQGVDCTEAILQNADLRYVNFTGANLKGADFMYADVREAILQDADLKDASLFYADLKKANLSGTNLEGANLLGTKFKGAILDNVRGVKRTEGSLSTIYPFIWNEPEKKIKALPPAKNKYHQFRRDTLYAKSAFSVVSTEFFLLSGVGALVGIWTQAWYWAVGTVAMLFLLAYVLGYRKALTLLPLSLIALLSGTLAYGITLLLTPFHYDQTQSSFIWFNTVRIMSLKHQIIAGTCIGAICSLCSFYIFTSSNEFGTFFDYMFCVCGVLYGIGGGLLLWLIVNLLGSVFNWGFGFGYGWNFNLFCGFLVTALAGIGIICLLYIWAKARGDSQKKF